LITFSKEETSYAGIKLIFENVSVSITRELGGMKGLLFIYFLAHLMTKYEGVSRSFQTGYLE
jgi:hypothetical protein